MQSSSIRYAGAYAFPLLKFRRRIFSRNKGAVKVLTYHHVPPENQQDIRKQLNWLGKRYSFIDPEAFHDFLEGHHKINNRQILITVDDGFASGKALAQTVFAELGLRAIYFIPIGFVAESLNKEWKNYLKKSLGYSCSYLKNSYQDMQPMNIDDLIWLRSKGHSIGAHTVSHYHLSHMREPQQLEYEITAPQKILEELLDEEINAMAYPFGDINSINHGTFAVIRKHYRYCYSGIRGVNTSKTPNLAVKREAVSLNYPPNYLEFLMEGGLDWYYFYKSKRLDRMTKSQ